MDSNAPKDIIILRRPRKTRRSQGWKADTWIAAAEAHTLEQKLIDLRDADQLARDEFRAVGKGYEFKVKGT